MELATASYIKENQIILKALLKKQFFNEDVLEACRKIFSGDLKLFLSAFAECHKATEGDITLDEVKLMYLHRAHDTTSRREYILQLIAALEGAPEVQPDVMQSILCKVKDNELLLQISRQVQDCIMLPDKSIRDVVEYINGLTLPEEEIEFTEFEVSDEELLQHVNRQGEFRYNNGLEFLNDCTVGLDRGEHMLVFARPEVGKSTFVSQLDVGFLKQGYKVLYLANEDSCHKIKLNHVRSALNKSDKDLRDMGVLPHQWKELDKNLSIYDITGKNMRQVVSLIEKVKPDIVVADQLDNVLPGGIKEDRRDLVIDVMYQLFRATVKMNNCLGISITQASADAKGILDKMSQEMTKDSRTGKAASTDIMLGIGYNNINDTTRCINVLKNKRAGTHDTIICNLDYERARYTE